jgi:hypothetical protein
VNILSQDRTTLLAAGVYLGSLLVSVLWFFLFPLDFQEQVLFFPDTVSGRLRGEVRLMPKQEEQQAEVAQLIDELLLGPTGIQSTRLLPRGVSRESTLVAGDVVYADLSIEAATLTGAVSLEEALFAVRKSILYNFRRFSSVVITIGGQVPFEPVYEKFQNSP